MDQARAQAQANVQEILGQTHSRISALEDQLKEVIKVNEMLQSNVQAKDQRIRQQAAMIERSLQKLETSLPTNGADQLYIGSLKETRTAFIHLD